MALRKKAQEQKAAAEAEVVEEPITEEAAPVPDEPAPVVRDAIDHGAAWQERHA